MIQVLLRRNRTGLSSFDRPWEDYIAGFGDRRLEFWVGLDPALRLLAGQGVLMRHDIVTVDMSRSHALYRGFRLGSETLQYALMFASFLDSNSSAGKQDNNGMT